MEAQRTKKVQQIKELKEIEGGQFYDDCLMILENFSLSQIQSQLDSVRLRLNKIVVPTQNKGEQDWRYEARIKDFLSKSKKEEYENQIEILEFCLVK